MSRISAIIKDTISNSCPRCHKGKVWRVNALKAFVTKEPMHKRCSECALLYDREPGFWFGAMFVSYAINVALFVAAWIVSLFIFTKEDPLLHKVLFIVLFSFLFVPITWRWSRLLWLNFFTGERTR